MRSFKFLSKFLMTVVLIITRLLPAGCTSQIIAKVWEEASPQMAEWLGISKARIAKTLSGTSNPDLCPTFDRGIAHRRHRSCRCSLQSKWNVCAPNAV